MSTFQFHVSKRNLGDWVWDECPNNSFSTGLVHINKEFLPMNSLRISLTAKKFLFKKFKPWSNASNISSNMLKTNVGWNVGCVWLPILDHPTFENWCWMKFYRDQKKILFLNIGCNVGCVWPPHPTFRPTFHLWACAERSKHLSAIFDFLT